MKKITIIIPAYNVEKYIIQCLDSLKSQTYKNIEIIVVDDGSKDNTLNLVTEYAQSQTNIKVLHQENGGVCSARNKGLENASGDYVTFVDADDYLPNDSLQFLFEDLTQNNADIAVGGVWAEKDVYGGDNTVNVWKGLQPLRKLLEDHPILYGSCGKLIKRDFLDDVRYVVGRKVHEDGFFMFQLLVKQPVVVARNKCAYVYRYNPESASHAKFSDKFFDVLYFEKIKREEVLKNFPELSDLVYNNLVKAHLTMLHLFCSTKDKKYNKDVKLSIKAVKKHAKYFIPAVKSDKKFFLIVKSGLYGLFRRLYWIKYKVKK